MRNSRNPGKPEFSDAIKKAGKCGYPGAAAISFCWLRQYDTVKQVGGIVALLVYDFGVNLGRVYLRVSQQLADGVQVAPERQ